MKPHKKEFQFGKHQVTLETGVVARQATGAVLARMDDTTVLVTVVAKKDAAEGTDFLPLSVFYAEKTYAAGKIPGGFFKREGRPSEKETLTCRLIDRPIRPLFPKGFYHEVQVIAQVLSVDGQIDPDILAMLGTSAALAISGLPFNGPVGAARVGYTTDGEYVLNPTFDELKDSKLDLVVSGTKSAVLMVESEAEELPEETMLGAVMFGHQQMQVAIDAINELASEVNKAPFAWKKPEEDQQLKDAIVAKAHAGLVEAYAIQQKTERKDKIDEIKAAVLEEFVSDEDSPSKKVIVEGLFGSIEKRIVRDQVLETGSRIDGRDTKTVRPIFIETGILPRTHGSTLFTRGETQAIVTATLGTEKDSQIIDALEGERKDPFLLHYNFPPFCVGETGMFGAPKRREIGHGRLAKRSLARMMPTLEDFPYAIRVVSEITESNGSSSMATVCGASLAMMDAGVPVKAPVAGIAMGLIKEEDGRYAVLTDILGDEDHLGDMDFKVAGTANGVNALQMDIKIEGITEEIMQAALAQAKDGRDHILGEMNKVMNAPSEMSEHAPRIISFSIHPDKIRDVIGKGGVTIRKIIDDLGVTIDLNDEGLVKIGAVDPKAGEAARKQIELITAEAEVGQVYEGTVSKILDFGAIVNFLPNKDGLVHISEIAPERINKVSDKLTEGDIVNVKVIEVDRQGRIRLSIKQVS